MYCKECGKYVKDGAPFCGFCGATLSSAQQMPVSAGVGANASMPTPSVMPQQSQMASMNKSGLSSKFSVYSISYLAMAIVSLIVAIVFAWQILDFGQVYPLFSGLVEWPAGVGTAIYFAFALVPTLLLFFVVLEAAYSFWASMTDSSQAPMPSGSLKKIKYFAVGILVVCILILIASAAFLGSAENDMTISLSSTLEHFHGPAVAGVFVSIAIICVTIVFNKKLA